MSLLRSPESGSYKGSPEHKLGDLINRRSRTLNTQQITSLLLTYARTSREDYQKIKDLLITRLQSQTTPIPEEDLPAIKENIQLAAEAAQDDQFAASLFPEEQKQKKSVTFASQNEQRELDKSGTVIKSTSVSMKS